MEKLCPNCKNEIYQPYAYCNSCGWINEEEKKKKEGRRKRLEKIKQKLQTEVGGKVGKILMKIPCKCGGVIEVKTKKRPLDFVCPKCGRKGTLKGKPPSEKPREKAAKKPPARYKPVTIPCKCGGKIVIRTSKRPVDIECPKCGRRGKFGGKGDKQERPSKPGKDEKKKEKPQKGKEKPKPVAVPCKCGHKIIVRTSKRPVEIECPKCGRKGVLGAKKAPKKPPRKPPKSEEKKEKEVEEKVKEEDIEAWEDVEEEEAEAEVEEWDEADVETWDNDDVEELDEEEVEVWE